MPRSTSSTLVGAAVRILGGLREPCTDHGAVRPDADRPGLLPGPSRPPTPEDGGLAGADHSAVIVSFKALPTDILSGADDAALTHFFDTAPTGHPIYYSYYHEPEDNIADGAVYPGGLQSGLGAGGRARGRGAQSGPAFHPDPDELGPGQGDPAGLEVLPARVAASSARSAGTPIRMGSATERQPAAHPAGRFHGPVHHGVRERRAALRVSRNSACPRRPAGRPG